MSSIEKLVIRGIRSYSGKGDEEITFAKPLTLIVGANGSGKTTIIECLRYSLTGELPPGSNAGRAFIHDPKCDGMTQVNARVNLDFKEPNGANVTLHRNISASIDTKGQLKKKEQDVTITRCMPPQQDEDYYSDDNDNYNDNDDSSGYRRSSARGGGRRTEYAKAEEK